MRTYLFILCLLPQITLASVPGGCGEYFLKGVVRGLKDGMGIIVNEKTLSSHIIKFPIEEQTKLGVYLDKEISATIIVQKQFDGMNISAEKILSITSRLPDPLNPKDTGLDQKSKTSCL